MESWITQLRRACWSTACCWCCGRARITAIEIVQALKRIEDLAVSESTIYPILGRLKAEGF